MFLSLLIHLDENSPAAFKGLQGGNQQHPTDFGMCFPSVLSHASNCTAAKKKGLDLHMWKKSCGSLLANHILRCAATHSGLQSSVQHGQLVSMWEKSLEVPHLLRSHSASPQGPKEFNGFPRVTNVLVSRGFQC